MRTSFIVALAAAAFAVSLRDSLGEANAVRRANVFRYTPNPKIVKLLAAGHRSTLANVMWLQTLPDLSRTFADIDLKRRWLRTSLEIITELEPRFDTVYSFGSSYLSMIGQDPQASIEMLERGAERNPDCLRLQVELAMAYFTHRDDREATMRVLKDVVDQCDAMTMAFYASLLVDERADVAAVSQWLPYLEDGNALVREQAELRLQRTYRRIALRARNEYRDATGSFPVSKQEFRGPQWMAPEIHRRGSRQL